MRDAGTVVVPRVDPQANATAEAVVRFPHRGLYQVQDGFLFSAFPFGFFRTTRPMSDHHRILVYPALVEIRAILSRLSRSGGAGVIPLPDGDDFTDLRPYRPGDRMKDIHWKATAKRGDMMVREFRAGITHRVNLILDTAPESAPSHFERAVSIAASISLHLIKQGLAVRLITGTTNTDFCGDREAACRILDTLAIVQPDVSARVPEGPADGAINILVLCRKSSPFALLRPSMTETIHVPSV